MTPPAAEPRRSPPELTGARALVLGLGRFGGGLGASRWLLGQGARVTVSDRLDRRDLAASADELEAAGAELALGGHESVDVSRFDLLVVNPAVPLSAPLVQEARAAGVDVTSEMALLLERWPGPVMGVTGSNGKSTTVSMAAALLGAAGVSAVAGGNLGGSLLARLAEADPSQVAVVELSSFMLEMTGPLGLGPDVAVITNITPNHLDRHGSFEAYRDAKAQVLARSRTAVLPVDDPVVSGLSLPPGCQRLVFGPAGPAVDLGPDGEGHLVDRAGERWLAGPTLAFPGRVARLDLAAAALAAGAVLRAPERIRETLAAGATAWRPPPHRLARVARQDGIDWIDDSVSTTPESTAASLEAVGAPCVLICGGHDKGLEPGALIEAAVRHARLVLTVGEEGPALREALVHRGVEAVEVGRVEAAVTLAAERARKGDTVLLSPGYSSHDQFVHFEARGAAFGRAVVERLRASGADAVGRGA